MNDWLGKSRSLCLSFLNLIPMKQALTILLLSWTLTFSLSAQDTTLTFLQVELDTIQVSPNTFEEYIYFNLINLADDPLQVSAQRFRNDLQPGHGSFFCWDLCYDTIQDVANDPILIAPGDTTEFEQYLVLKPNGIEGLSAVEMFFADTVGFILRRTYLFQVSDATTSVASFDSERGYLSAPYPNPSQGPAQITYHLPLGVARAQLQVLDGLGREVARQELTQRKGTATLHLAQAPRGLYLVRLVAQQQTLLSQKWQVN